VACDHHERAARFVSKRQRHPGGALGQANLVQQRPEEERVLVERQRQLGLRRGQALASLEKLDIVSGCRRHLLRNSTCVWSYYTKIWFRWSGTSGSTRSHVPSPIAAWSGYRVCAVWARPRSPDRSRARPISTASWSGCGGRSRIPSCSG